MPRGAPLDQFLEVQVVAEGGGSFDGDLGRLMPGGRRVGRAGVALCEARDDVIQAGPLVVSLLGHLLLRIAASSVLGASACRRRCALLEASACHPGPVAARSVACRLLRRAACRLLGASGVLAWPLPSAWS